MKGEAEEEEEEWAEGGRGLVVGGWSFFRFLLAGAAGEAEVGEGPLLVAACAVGGAVVEVAGVVLEAAVGVVVVGALGLRALRFFLADCSEGGAAGVGVEEDEAGSGRRGKKLSNIMPLGSQQRGGACVCGSGEWGVGLRQLVLGMGKRRTEEMARLGKQRPHSWLPSTDYAYV